MNEEWSSDHPEGTRAMPVPLIKDRKKKKYERKSERQSQVDESCTRGASTDNKDHINAALLLYPTLDWYTDGAIHATLSPS